MKFFLVTILLFVASLDATAQHSDVWLILNGNTVAVSPQDLENGADVLIDQTTGYFLFEGDFGDFGGQHITDDPGFQAEEGTFQPGAILGYVASGVLNFWDGDQWTNDLPGSESLHLFGTLGTDTAWHSTWLTNPEGTVDQVFPDGDIHSHLDFTIETTPGNGDPSVGAYLVELSLLARDGLGGPVAHELSVPFRIAFNNQLSAQEFDEAINALTTRRGDVNVDGRVDVADLLLVQRAIIGEISLNATQIDLADLHGGDGVVGVSDLLLLEKLVTPPQ